MHKSDKLDLSICIAHAGDVLGLWATIHSCEADLADSGLRYEYRICVNAPQYDSTPRLNGTYLSRDLYRLLHYLDKSGSLGYLKISGRALSPPSARHIAASGSKAKYLFFLDNHCLVAKGYFLRALHTFAVHNAGIVHSTTRFFSGEKDSYHYELTLNRNFWATSSFEPQSDGPYRIAAGGHGGLAVRKQVWDAVGGYWDGFVGYGGEEMYFDLAACLIGFTNYLDPELIHYHYAGTRPYPRHYTDDFYRNMMMCAHIIGGEEWLYRVYDSFENKFPEHKTPTFELLMQAHAKSEPQRLKLSQRFGCSLDELLAKFKQKGIAH